jgi:TRAP-type C4-dicarboxylate transport system permease large subunit
MNNVVESSSLICMYTIFVIVILVRSCGTKSVASSHSNAKRRSQIRVGFLVSKLLIFQKKIPDNYNFKVKIKK